MRPGPPVGLNFALTLAFAFALASAAAAVGLRWLLDPLLRDHMPLVTMFAAVAVSVWYGGYRPAVLTAIVGYFACHYLFIQPRGSIDLSTSANWIGLVAYLISTGIIIAFGDALRRARRVAHDRRELLQLTLASIGDAVIATDADGRIDFMNGIAAQLTGWSSGDAAGQPLATVFHIINETTRQPVENPANKALREGAIVGLANHTILVAKDGIERPIDDSAAPIRDADGRVVGCVLVFRDISRRRQAELALERSESELRDFFENASVGLHWAGPDGTILRANQTELEMLGYSREEYVGKSVADFHADPDVGADILRRLAEGETLANYPARLRCKDGTTKDVLISSNVLWEDGKFVHSRCFTRDVTDLKRASGARTLLAAVVDSSDDAIISKSLDGTILSWNRGAERLFGYSAAEAIGQSILLIIPPDRRDEETSIIQHLRSGKRIDHFETVRVSKSGQPIDISVTISPIRDETGHIVGASKVARDITERKRASEALFTSEQRLRDRENQLRVITDATPALISYIDAQERYQFVNRQYETWFGRSADETLGRTMTDVLGAEAVAVLRPHIDAVLRGKRVHFETQAPYRDGGTRWIEGQYEPDVDAAGNVRGFFVLVLDVSERKRSQQALQVQQDRLSLAQKAAHIGHFEWNAVTDENIWSPELEALYGLAPGTFAGGYDGWARLVHPDDLPQAERDIQRSFETGELVSEWRVVWPDGTTHWLHAQAKIFYDTHGRPQRMVGVNFDLTERKRAEEQLREADRRKDEFLATLAHELRNPLAPIRNSLEIMKRAGSDPSLVDQARSTMDRQVGLMERLIDDLLDVSRITRNKLELRRTRIELASVVHHALEASRPLADALRHEVLVDLPAEPIYLHGDAARLAQVFSNLLNNACKYTEPGGRIAVSARRDDGNVVVTIRDSGIGIPREMLPRIFDMFTQVGRSLERAQGGLGIGLTLVKQLVELHDGQVEAHSEGVGCGSNFIVRLPVDTSAPQTVETSPSMPPPVADQDTVHEPAASRRVLVVDDNKDGAESLGRLLRLAGHEIRLAFDGLQAIETAEQFQPELVLLDIGLPKLNGYEACRRIRQQPWGRRMSVVALTGWGQDSDRRKSKDAGFDSHLVKPVDVATLLKLLDTLPATSEPN